MLSDLTPVSIRWREGVTTITVEEDSSTERLEAFHQFKEEYTNLPFALVGEGSWRAENPHRLCRWEQGETLRLFQDVGGRRRMYMLKRTSSDDILPSHPEEGIPVEVLQFAAACLRFTGDLPERRTPWRVVAKGHHRWIESLWENRGECFSQRGAALHTSNSGRGYLSRAMYVLDFLEVLPERALISEIRAHVDAPIRLGDFEFPDAWEGSRPSRW